MMFVQKTSIKPGFGQSNVVKIIKGGTSKNNI